MSHYYVYAYIDPRNYEEFYYGKGKGSRKDVHVNRQDGGPMAIRIREIQKESLRPIIRVIAANLTESEALLIEATLIWKLGKYTHNIATGHFADKFRPHNKYHCELPGFDYQNGLYYFNTGESKTHRRIWEDYVEHGFISGGQGVKWRDAMLSFNEGDIIAAYISGKGYVGIGRIKLGAQMIRAVTIKGKPLRECLLRSKKLFENANCKELSEYVCIVDWLSVVARKDAKWERNKKLFTSRLLKASLTNQPATTNFLEKHFKLDFTELIM